MQSGNRLLRHKLTYNCFGLSFETLHTTKFPFAALNLPKLRSLSLSGIKDVPIYVDFRNVGKSALVKGSKTIEKVDFRFCNSLALFLGFPNSVPRLSVRDRFPSLTTLTLHGIMSEELLGRLFGELPESLTSFSLHCDELDAFICLSSIAKLPRHLKTLNLVDCYINNPSDPDFKFETALPPNLTHLNMQILRGIEILDYLPSTLKLLHFETSYNPSGNRWKFSKIPAGLTSLETSLSRHLFEIDAPLPSTMEKFLLSFACFRGASFTIDSLPKKIKSVPQHLFYPKPSYESVVKRFPQLEYALINRETTVALLPETLKTLECEKSLQFDSALPSALKKLYLRSPPPSENLQNIPPSLTSLSFSSFDGRKKKNSSEIMAQFPPWTESDFAHIASRIRLVTLDINFKLIESAYALTPLAKLETLKKISLSRISLQGIIDAPKWIPNCLPYNLKELYLSVSGKDPNEIDIETEKEFFHHIDLSKVTPRLISLTVYCHYKAKLIFTLKHELFASLPRGLLKLCFSFDSAFTPLGAVSHLPRSLQYLQLGFGNLDQLHHDLSDDHFEGLPETLSEFRLQTERTHSITPKLFDILPRSIVRMDWRTQAMYNEFDIRRKEFLSSNPFAEGFPLSIE